MLKKWTSIPSWVLSKFHYTDGCIYCPSNPYGRRFILSSLFPPVNNLFQCLIVITIVEFFSHVWLKFLHLHVNHISLSFDLSRGGKPTVTITLIFLFLLKANASSIVQISDSSRLRFPREKYWSVPFTWNRHYFISEPRDYLKSKIVFKIHIIALVK